MFRIQSLGETWEPVTFNSEVDSLCDECQTHYLKASAQLLLLCVSSLTEWQTQDSLALKKILSAKIPKEKELAASPTLFLFPKPKQGIFPLSSFK